MTAEKRRILDHVRELCCEHFGVNLSDEQIEEIGQLCRSGRYLKISDSGGSIGFYRAQLGAHLAAVGYDRDRELVLTALPAALATRQRGGARKLALDAAEAVLLGAAAKEDNP